VEGGQTITKPQLYICYVALHSPPRLEHDVVSLQKTRRAVCALPMAGIRIPPCPAMPALVCSINGTTDPLRTGAHSIDLCV
jgi:hypothetical protein